MSEIIYTWGYPIFKGSLSDIEWDKKKQFLINTISPNSYGLAQKDNKVAEALQKSDMLILDGLYFGWAALFLKGIKINRIAGWDSFQFFSKWANENKKKVFFLGSSSETLGLIKERFKKDFPNVEIETYSPPFKVEFSDQDNHEMQSAINSFEPDILFVGLTAPKQEKWAYTNKSALNVTVISTIGNVFDWYAGNTKRPGVFWQKAGLEWFIRIFYRPEVFRRNIANQMLFFWHLFLTIVKIRKND